MNSIATEHDMIANGMVSIWIGSIDDEDDLLEYVEDPNGMGRDFGCVLERSRELCAVSSPEPIRKLLEGFSYWKSFIDEATAGTDELTASCAVVAYACDYSKIRHAKNERNLRFLCTASFA